MMFAQLRSAKFITERLTDQQANKESNLKTATVFRLLSLRVWRSFGTGYAASSEMRRTQMLRKRTGLV